MLLIFSALLFVVSDVENYNKQLAIYSQVDGVGSITYGGRVSYTISFDITVQNISKEMFFFNDVCIRAYLPSSEVVSFGAIEFDLPNMLSPGGEFYHHVTFISHSKKVYEARVLKIERNSC